MNITVTVGINPGSLANVMRQSFAGADVRVADCESFSVFQNGSVTVARNVIKVITRDGWPFMFVYIPRSRDRITIHGGVEDVCQILRTADIPTDKLERYASRFSHDKTSETAR